MRERVSERGGGGILLGLLGGGGEDDVEILMQKIPTHMKCDVLLTTYNSPLLNSFLPSFPSHPILSRPLSHQPSSLSLSPISQLSNNPPRESREMSQASIPISPPYLLYLPTLPNKQRKRKIKIDPEKNKISMKKFQDLFLPSHPYSDTLTDNTDTPKNTFRVPRFFWRVK